MLRAVARLSLVVLLAGPAIVLTASSCGACSCAPRTPKQLFRRADAAFVGSVTSQEAINQVTTMQTFSVRGVYKGDLGPTVRVIQPIGSGGGDTCGILYGGGTVAVILHRQGESQGEGWTTDVCSRITIAQLASVAPTPTHPRPTASASSTPLAPPALEGSSSPGWGTVVLGLFVGVAAIALALSVGGRRDRGRAPALGATQDGSPEEASDPTEPSG